MEKKLPDGIIDVINSESITCCKFNSVGTILAAGCYDGKAILFDWSIKSVLRSGIAHSKPISKIAWFHSQDQVATACIDGFIVIWSIPSFKPIISFNLKQSFIAIHSISCSKHSNSILLCTNNSVFLISNDQIQKIPQDASLSNFTGTFINSGDCFIIGDSSGSINLYSNNTLLHSLKASNIPIAALEMHSELDEFLFNQSETVIKSCIIDTNANELQLTNVRFSNEIDRIKWTNYVYLASGCFVAGICSKGISIWDTVEGHFFKFYEDYPKEGISFLVPIPKSNDFIGVSYYGYVYIWSKKRVENWAAYAPNFTPIEQNIEYFEREDEFDIDLETGLPVAYATVERSIEENIDIGDVEEEKKKVFDGPSHMYLTLDNLTDDEIATYNLGTYSSCRIVDFC